jgi:hypothetical protein
MEFNKENLVAFENVYFKNWTNELRYGQALQKVFGTSVFSGVDYFYETDNSYVRDMVWLEFLK